MNADAMMLRKVLDGPIAMTRLADGKRATYGEVLEGIVLGFSGLFPVP